MGIYATIRKQSKYYRSQQDFKGKRPVPFPVRLDFESDPQWPVKGGLGGQYALFDVDLYFVRGDELIPLPIHVKP